MPLQPYSTGTIGVTNGSTAIAGTGVAWLPATVTQGDLLFVPSQNAFGVIDSVNDTYDGITLYQPWSGATASGLSYLILPSSWQRYDPALTQATTRSLLRLLSGSGIIYYVPAGQSPDPGLATTNGQLAVQVTDGLWAFWVSESGAWVSLPPPGTSRPQRSVTAAPVVISSTDQILNLNLPAAEVITLPGYATRAGEPLTFNDASKNAGNTFYAQTITAAEGETIDGNASVVLNEPGQAITLLPFNDGVNAGWKQI